MEGFVGRYERQLDPKGRVALPATFRNRLEPRCYLVLGQDKCISVVSVAVSMSWAAEMIEAVKRGDKSRAELRAMAANMVEVQVDAQGRVTLDENLRAFAGLRAGAKVVVSGAFDSVEIWEPERFARLLATGEEVIAGPEFV